MRKMYFVVNLVAGKAMIAEKLGKTIDEFTKADFEVTIHTTQSGDDAARAAEYACEKSFDLLVCAGGDGTLSQCLQGIMNSDNRIPIGYIPAGSTNDFAKSLGIPKDTMQAVERIINGKPFRVMSAASITSILLLYSGFRSFYEYNIRDSRRMSRTFSDIQPIFSTD